MATKLGNHTNGNGNCTFIPIESKNNIWDSHNNCDYSQFIHDNVHIVRIILANVSIVPAIVFE